MSSFVGRYYERHYGSREKSTKLVFEGVVTFVLSFLVIQFSSQQSKA